jgi:hypothetical protein
VMAQSVTRRIERNLTASVAFEPGQLIRPRSAESIKASGYARPRRKAGHMTASDHCSSRKKFLQAGGHPHMRRPLIVPNAFAALTLEKTDQLAFAAIEHGLSDTRKGTADGTAALRILRPLGR